MLVLAGVMEVVKVEVIPGAAAFDDAEGLDAGLGAEAGRLYIELLEMLDRLVALEPKVPKDVTEAS